MVITEEDLQKGIKEIPLYYGDDSIRCKNHAIKVDISIISNIFRIKIEGGLLLFLDGKNREVMRIKLSSISAITINKEFGEYVISKA